MNLQMITIGTECHVNTKAKEATKDRIILSILEGSASDPSKYIQKDQLQAQVDAADSVVVAE